MPRRVTEFREWHDRRERLRPSAEEQELQHQLRQMVDRRRRRANKIAKLDAQHKRENDDRERAATKKKRCEEETRIYGSVAVSRYMEDENDEAELEARREWEKKNRVSIFEDLPFEIRARVFDFLPVIPEFMTDDLYFICSYFLPTDDAMCLYEPQVAKEAFDFVEKCLEEHKEQYVAAATVGIVIGLSDSCLFHAWNTAMTTAATKRLANFPSVTQLVAAHKQRTSDGGATATATSAATTKTTTLAATLTNERETTFHLMSEKVRKTLPFSEQQQKQQETEDDEAAAQQTSAYHCCVPHQQRRRYGQMIGAAQSELARQRTLLDLCQRWVRFEKLSIETPCSILRFVLRECLDSWSHRLATQMPECALRELLSANIESMGRNVKAAEFVGDPRTEAEDVRDMMWDALSMHLPQGVDRRSYGASLTLGQIVALGISDLPWVRGFAWQDRSKHIVKRADIDITKMMAQFPALATLRELSLDQVVDTQAAIEAREAEDRRIRGEQQLAAEGERRERMRKTALDALARRVFLPAGKPRPFGSCEMCCSIHVHVVGLKKPGSAVMGDIALCQDCYLDVYEPNDTIHKLYEWELVSSVVGPPPKQDGSASD